MLAAAISSLVLPDIFNQYHFLYEYISYSVYFFCSQTNIFSRQADKKTCTPIFKISSF